MRLRRASLMISASVAVMLFAGLAAGCSVSQPPLRSVGSPTSKPLTTDDWAAVEADPGAFTGRPVSIVGEVFSAYDAQSSTPNFQMWVRAQEPVGVAVVTLTADPGVRKGDRIAVTGTILGEYTGTGPFAGSGMTAVLVKGSSLEPTAVPAPATP